MITPFLPHANRVYALWLKRIDVNDEYIDKLFRWIDQVNGQLFLAFDKLYFPDAPPPPLREAPPAGTITMTKPMEEFDALLKAGKRAEALALLEAEKIKAKFSPNEVIEKKGQPPVLKARGKQVEMDEQGNWQPKKK